jgi:predicted TPR repeat methyltransferase
MDRSEVAKEHFFTGLDHLQKEQYLEAEQRFRSSLELASDKVATYINLSFALLKANKLEQSEATCLEGLKIDRQSSELWLNLGLVRNAMNNHAAAIDCFNNATKIDPNYPDNWYYSGFCLSHLKRYSEALTCFEKTLDLSPYHVGAMCGIGHAQAKMNHYFSSLATFDRAINLISHHPDPYFAKASVLQDMKQHTEAAACYKLALEHKHPDRNIIEYMIASLLNLNPPDCPPREYVARLFDSYANEFEKHLVGRLQYAAPERFRTILFDRLRPNLKILDLGCGTGLIGAMLKKKADKLIGVDLSKNMLEIAGQKNIYDQLIQADIVEYLRSCDTQFDLVIAADVLIYVGELSETFSLVSQALPSGGLFAFTVEQYEGSGYFLNTTLRYSHSEEYCLAKARACGLDLRIQQPDLLRLGNSTPDDKVWGDYFLFEKR